MFTVTWKNKEMNRACPSRIELHVSHWYCSHSWTIILFFYLFIKFPKLISFHMMAFYHLNSCSRFRYIQTKIINSNFLVHCIRENLNSKGQRTWFPPTSPRQVRGLVIRVPGFLLVHGMYKFQHFHFLFDPLCPNIDLKQHFEFPPVLGTLIKSFSITLK